MKYKYLKIILMIIVIIRSNPLKDTIILSGHHSPASYSDLKLYCQMLTESMNWVKSQIKHGVSLKDMTQKNLPHFLVIWEDPGRYNTISGQESITTIYHKIINISE